MSTTKSSVKSLLDDPAAATGNRFDCAGGEGGEVSAYSNRCNQQEEEKGAGLHLDNCRLAAVKPSHGLNPYIAGILGDMDRELVENDPIGRQYVPSTQEQKTSPQEMHDPIGDDKHTPVKGLVHRYPDRVLLKISNSCPVYCRYCFRKEMIGKNAGSSMLSGADLDNAVSYIKNNKSIWEVILSGGDPLILSPRRISGVIEKISGIEHIKILRIHTRVPVSDPDKITNTICSVLGSFGGAVYVVVHINHVKEIAPKAIDALQRLRSAGCSLLSQSVLLKGVNDNPETLENLFRRLVQLRVTPYYLHHLDLAAGTEHFRVSIKRGQEIMRRLQGRVSGICLPKYMLDIPKGYGKIPVNHNYVTNNEKGNVILEDIAGGTHLYPPSEAEI